MVDDWVIKTMYATKRRRRNTKIVRPLVGKESSKSNPSKRHRERLNSELDVLAGLLPFTQNVITKLDKLSILRLAVSYLRMKMYFQSLSCERTVPQNVLMDNRGTSHMFLYPNLEATFSEGEVILEALNGFVFIVSCDGEVFSASSTVETYLGFHQSDIIHQSVLELIHSEDREEFRRQLKWNHHLPEEKKHLTLQEVMLPENCAYLQRSFTVRFRCLLDNTSGFITLEICGRIGPLHGYGGSSASYKRQQQHSASSISNNNNNQLNLGLFAVCCPFGPMPSLDSSQRDHTFKSKHHLNFALVNMDMRARVIFGFTEKEVINVSCYGLLHPDDADYVAQGHHLVLSNTSGHVGLLVHRWLNKFHQKWIWLQSSVKIVMKNGKKDGIIITHRQLMEEEGRELLTRRNREYKLPFPLLEPETLLCEEDADETSHGEGSKSYTKSSSSLPSGAAKRPRYATTAGPTPSTSVVPSKQHATSANRKRKTPYREQQHSLLNGMSNGMMVDEMLFSHAAMLPPSGPNPQDMFSGGYSAYPSCPVLPHPLLSPYDLFSSSTPTTSTGVPSTSTSTPTTHHSPSVYDPLYGSMMSMGCTPYASSHNADLLKMASQYMMSPPLVTMSSHCFDLSTSSTSSLQLDENSLVGVVTAAAHQQQQVHPALGYSQQHQGHNLEAYPDTLFHINSSSSAVAPSSSCWFSHPLALHNNSIHYSNNNSIKSELLNENKVSNRSSPSMLAAAPSQSAVVISGVRVPVVQSSGSTVPPWAPPESSFRLASS